MVKTKEQYKTYRAHWHEKNKEDQNKKNLLYKKNITIRVNEMLKIKTIGDPYIWHLYCNTKRNNGQTKKKYPYSIDFTDDIFFEKMKDGCVYCDIRMISLKFLMTFMILS